MLNLLLWGRESTYSLDLILKNCDLLKMENQNGHACETRTLKKEKVPISLISLFKVHFSPEASSKCLKIKKKEEFNESKISTFYQEKKRVKYQL